MYPATVTRFFFYSIWTLFLHPQVIKSVNPIDRQVYQLSRLKRSPQDDANDVAWGDAQARSGIGSAEDTSDEETRRFLVPDDDILNEDTRRAAATSSENSSDDEARRAPDFSHEDSDQETRKAARHSNKYSDEKIDDDSDDKGKYARTSFWKKIMDSAIQKAIAPLNSESDKETRRSEDIVSSEQKSIEETRKAAVISEESSGETRRQAASSSNEPSSDETRRAAATSDENTDDETRRQAVPSSNEQSSDETRRAAATSDENTDDETRRQAVSSSNEHSNEETRRAAVISEESPDEETRRDAGVAVGPAGSTEDMTGDGEATGKDAANLEGTSHRGTRRFQKNVNFNQNVNTNINSNVQIDSLDFPRDEEYRPHYGPDANLQQYTPDDVLEKLQTCDIFRDNIISVMGYLLRLPDGLLSVHEYSSLEMIYNAMKAKSIYMYNLLPTLHSLRDKSFSQQFGMVLKEIGNNLPSYMKSATAFWINRINDRKINLDSILSKSSEINILADISDQAFSNSRRRGATDEMAAFDEGSKITAELMGPIYVTIFRQLNQMNRKFTQLLFGTIIRDLPNTDSDPVFEEYVRYIAEETWSDKIPNWTKHCRELDATNPYALVVSLVDEICTDDMVPLQMKRAFLYIRHHFTDSGRRILRNVVRDTRTITENGLNIDMLFKVVVPYHTDDIDEMKFRLRGYLLPNPDKDVARILAGINRFRYNTPTDLLLAFLARLQMRLAPTNDIQMVASALLSNLLFPTTVVDISIPENGAIAFWIIIDSIVEPDTNETIRSLVTSLQLSLLNNLKGWDKVQMQLIPSRNECTYPRKCLLTILEKFKMILDDKPSLLPKGIVDIVEQLSNYVSINLEEKNSPRPCFDTTVPATIPSVARHYVSPHTTRKLKNTSTKRPQTRDKLKSTFMSIVSSSTPLTITTKSPRRTTKLSKLKSEPSSAITKLSKISTAPSAKITEKPPKITTKPLKITTMPPKITTKPPKITTKPPKITTKPPKITAKPPKITTKPSQITVKPSESTIKSSKMKSKSSQITTMPSKISAQSTTTATPKGTSKFAKLQEITTKSPRIIPKPSKISPEPLKNITKSHNTASKAPKLMSRPPKISPQPPTTTNKIAKTTPEPKLSSKRPKISATTQKTFEPPKTTTTPRKKVTTPKINTIPPKPTPISSAIISQSPKIPSKPPKMAPKLSEITTKLPKITMKPSIITPKPLITTIQPLKTTTKLPKLAVKPSKPMDTTLKPISKLNNSSSKLPIKPTLKAIKPIPNSLSKTSDKSQSKTTTALPIERPKLKMINDNSSSLYSSIAKRSMLPPNMNSKDCIIFDIKSKNLNVSPSIYTKADASNLSSTAIVLPSMIELHGDVHHNNGVLENVNVACVKELKTKILSVVNETVGGSYETKLLGKGWKENYPTRISALMGILETALRHPKIAATTALRNDIEKYRDGLQFIGPYIYLPMLSRWKKFKGEIVWSSIDLNSDDFSIIANSPPKETERNVMTLPLINPSYWILPIDSKNGDPFPRLLPRLQTDSKYANQLKPLVDIFSHEKIKSTTGHPVDFSIFPNRGALLIHTLIQLKYIKAIQKNEALLKLINKYLNILQRPAMYIRIPGEVIADEQYDVHGGWTVDTVDLMELLPKPKSPADTKLYESMRTLLSKPNLLTELKIPIPPMETTKGSFMKIIIDKALQTTNITKNDAIKKALKYYQDKFDSKDRGRMNLGWIWSQKFIVSTEMHLGELIEALLPYKELSAVDQKAYDDLVAYFNNHPHFLNTHSMPLTEYKTRGAFLRGFFEHLLQESALDKKVKEKVNKLLSSVKMTGEGAKSMPPLARRAMPIVRPTWE